MEKDLRKRFEEAAEKYLEHVVGYDQGIRANPYLFDGKQASEIYIAGAEQGYKEAIARAKEWWKSYYKLPDYYYSETRDVQEKMRDDYKFDMEVVADFESYMNKLWEDEK